MNLRSDSAQFTACVVAAGIAHQAICGEFEEPSWTLVVMRDWELSISNSQQRPTTVHYPLTNDYPRFGGM